MYSYNKTNEMQ